MIGQKQKPVLNDLGITQGTLAGTRKCRLCLEEKLLIIKGRKKKNFSKKRSELFSKCQHACNPNLIICNVISGINSF